MRGQIPLCSSRQLVAALERLGCYRGRAGSGSHQSYHRQLPDDTVLTAPVVLGRTEIPRGTTRSILGLLQISPEEFREALR